MKLKSNIYLLPSTPVFNPDAVPLFENFDSEHSAILWSALYLNSVEILEAYHDSPHTLILDERDSSSLPEKIKGKKNIIFSDITNKELLLGNLDEKIFGKYDNNILFISSAIGFTHNDISKIFNLLNTNDDSIVLGRAVNNRICFTGFNTYPDFLGTDTIDYDYILAESCKHNSFLYILENYISVHRAGDFKHLYNELSKKESLSYCSQEMHEMFTHLFIEYKDLLK